MIGRQGHGQQRAAHGQKCRLQDIERVDLGLVRPADAETERVAPNLDAQGACAPPALRIFESAMPGDGPAGPQNHRGGDHGPRQRPASRLVDAGDARLTAMPPARPACAAAGRGSPAPRGRPRRGADRRECRTNSCSKVAAPFGIVKPHQELRSDRLRDDLFLKILADDAPIRK